jgi:nucleoside 2-deoxyribosyltransferase
MTKAKIPEGQDEYGEDINWDCYIASPFFTPSQLNELEMIKRLCQELGLKYFSPKDELLVKPGDSDEIKDKALRMNIRAMSLSKFIIVNTQDKDMGTIWEAGFSYAIWKPLIYYCSGLKGPFNLMLARTAACVATNPTQLKEYLMAMQENIEFKKPYVGAIE